MRNFIGQIAREKLRKGSYTLGDTFDDSKLRCSGADRREESGQHPVRHFAGRVVEERSQAECVYISGGGLGKWWGRRVHVRLLKIAWGSDADAACMMPGQRPTSNIPRPGLWERSTTRFF